MKTADKNVTCVYRVAPGYKLKWRLHKDYSEENVMPISKSISQYYWQKKWAMPGLSLFQTELISWTKCSKLQTRSPCTSVNQIQKKLFTKQALLNLRRQMPHNATHAQVDAPQPYQTSAGKEQEQIYNEARPQHWQWYGEESLETRIICKTMTWL